MAKKAKKVYDEGAYASEKNNDIAVYPGVSPLALRPDYTRVAPSGYSQYTTVEGTHSGNPLAIKVEDWAKLLKEPVSQTPATAPAADAPEIDLPYQLYGQSGGTQVGDYPELRLIKKPTAQQKRDALYDSARISGTSLEPDYETYWKYNPDGSLRITPQGPTESSAPQGSSDPASSEDPWKPWNDRMEEIYSQLANLPDYPTLGKFQGPEFNYDYRQDPAYQQYREQYIRNGQLAMKDTMGQAAGLTGGYGSSYAQNAAQQAYQGYMNQLNAVVPQLYKDAYGRYSDDYTRQYQEYKDDYTARVNAYNNQVDAVKTLASLINQDRQISLNERKQDFDEQKYQDALNAPAETNYNGLANYYSSIAKLAQVGIGVDANGNFYELPESGGTASVEHGGGGTRYDLTDIDGKTEDALQDEIASQMNTLKYSTLITPEAKKQYLMDWAKSEGYTDYQLQYIEDVIDYILSK